MVTAFTIYIPHCYSRTLLRQAKLVYSFASESLLMHVHSLTIVPLPIKTYVNIFSEKLRTKASLGYMATEPKKWKGFSNQQHFIAIGP